MTSSWCWSPGSSTSSLTSTAARWCWQEISRDILGLGGDQQRPSIQISSMGGESYLLPQEPLPAPDTQQQLVLSQDQAQQQQQVRQVDEGNQLVQIEEQQMV